MRKILVILLICFLGIGFVIVSGCTSTASQPSTGTKLTNSPSSHVTTAAQYAQTKATQQSASQQSQGDPIIGTWVYTPMGPVLGADTVTFYNDGTGESSLNGGQPHTFTWERKSYDNPNGHIYTITTDETAKGFVRDVTSDMYSDPQGNIQNYDSNHLWIVGWCAYVRGDQPAEQQVNQQVQKQAEQSSSSSSNENCVLGTWKLDRQSGRTDDILTWNFYSDGTFKDIHHFSNGNSQSYDWGTWEYLGNNRYVVTQTSTTMHVICEGDKLVHEESTIDVFHQG